MEDILDTAEVYRELSTIPTVLEAWLSSQGRDATVVWSAKDVVNGVSSKYVTQHEVRDNLECRTVGFPAPWHAEISSISPSGKLLATIRAEKGKEPGVATVEIWEHGKMVRLYRTTNSHHGEIYTDSRSGCLAWSNDETRLCYLAEEKPKDSQSFWDPKPGGERGEKYAFREDWGEQYTGRRVGRPFFIELTTGTIYQARGIPPNIHCVETTFCPGDDGIVFTGIEIDAPARYGLIYCYNRRSSLIYIPLDAFSPISRDEANIDTSSRRKIETCTIVLTVSDVTARSPRFSPTGNMLAYMSTPKVVTHNTCSSIKLLDWYTKTTMKLIEPVHSPGEKEFTGLYADKLPVRCWVGDSIIFNTLTRSYSSWGTVDTRSGVVTIDQKGESVLDITQDGRLLVLRSSPDSSHSVYIRDQDDLFKLISPGDDYDTGIDRYHVAQLNPKQDISTVASTEGLALLEKEVSNDAYEMIVSIPKGCVPARGWPVILDVHGGPHGNYPVAFRQSTAFFCRLGYAVVAPNYRGSTGFGQKALESLVGRVGSQDIEDVIHALETAIGSFGLDKENTFCTGGSHGGFICAHLISLHPAVFSACAIRNPVTNLTSQLCTSDIPDWGCAVAGLNGCEFTPLPFYMPKNEGPSNRLIEISQLLLSKSPMGNDLSKVQTPTLFGLGAKDRRVPPTEGLQFEKALRTHGVATKVIWYPEDTHPIESVEANADFFVNLATWFRKYRREQDSTLEPAC